MSLALLGGGPAVPPWTPNRVASLAFARDPGTSLVFTDAALTAAAADGNTVGGRTPRYGSGNEAQATAGSRFTLRTSPARLTTDGARVMAYTAVTLSGAFTAYAVGSAAASSVWVPFAGSGTYLGLFSDGNVYAISEDAVTVLSAPYTGAAGLILARFRRAVNNHVYFAATGMAEADLGAMTAAVAPAALGARQSASQFTAAGNDHRAEVLAAADLVTTGDDAAVVAYLKTLTGVTFP